MARKRKRSASAARAAHVQAQLKYGRTAKGKATFKKYRTSPKGKANYLGTIVPKMGKTRNEHGASDPEKRA